MKNRKLIFGFIVLGIILFNISIMIVMASDDDSDGIDDEYEYLNERNINIEFSEDEIEIQSVLRTGAQKDNIRFRIRNDSDGIEIELRYYPKFEGEEHEEVELEFSVAFHKLIEYVDLDSNNIYDESIDQTIQEIEINEFKPLFYSQIQISPNTTLHYFKLSTSDGVFTTHIYFSEEFTAVNGSLITPSQSKIDIEINNFNFTHGSSQLALYVKLESESDYEEKEETEDEKLGFASNEKSVFMSNQSLIGFLSWKETALIDGNESQILISSVETDDDDELEQKIYVNYPRGLNIYHDPKLGVEGILKSLFQPGFPLNLTIITIIIVSVISISVAYSVYHYKENLFPGIILAHERRKKLKKSKKLNSISEISEEKLHNPQLTAVSADFFKEIDTLDLKEKEKEQFIEDMLALNPFERTLILREMNKKSKLKEK